MTEYDEYLKLVIVAGLVNVLWDLFKKVWNTIRSRKKLYCQEKSVPIPLFATIGKYKTLVKRISDSDVTGYATLYEYKDKVQGRVRKIVVTDFQYDDEKGE